MGLFHVTSCVYSGMPFVYSIYIFISSILFKFLYINYLGWLISDVYFLFIALKVIGTVVYSLFSCNTSVMSRDWQNNWTCFLIYFKGNIFIFKHMKVKVEMFLIYLDYSIYTTFLFISILFLFIYLCVLYEFRKQNKSFYV